MTLIACVQCLHLAWLPRLLEAATVGELVGVVALLGTTGAAASVYSLLPAGGGR